MNPIKISIIVPIFNVEKFLEKCLDSIKNQTLTQIEIICVNDGSTDRSLEIMETYSKNDSRFKVISKTNSGYGHTLNTGIAAATGEFVGIVESDDYVDPKMFETLYLEAKKFDAEISKCNYSFYWSKPERFAPSTRFPFGKSSRLLNPAQDQELFDIPPTVWSAIYKRDFLEKNNIRFLETPGASYQDMGFTFKTWAFSKRVVLVPKELIFYRQDNEQSSIKSPSKVFCICDEFVEIDRVMAKHPELKEFKTIVSKLKFMSYLWNYLRLSGKLRSQFFDRMKSECQDIYRSKNYKVKDFKLKPFLAFMTLVNFPGLFKVSVKISGR